MVWSGGEDWRRVLALGAVAGPISPSVVALAAGIHPAAAEAAVAEGRRHGLIDGAGAMSEVTRSELLALLPSEAIAEVHAVMARRCFADGPGSIMKAIEHARAAGELITVDEIIAMADQGGRLSLSIGDHGTARRLLELADELDTDGDAAERTVRLCLLATALDGSGRTDDARDRLVQAVGLAELARRPDLVVRAAVQRAIPADWYTGDALTVGLLQRAEVAAVTAAERSQVLAARALTENRIPITEPGQQFAWVTRTATARRFADEALELAHDSDPNTRLLALLAWRTTHRAPHFLERRRETSLAALHLAEDRREPSLQIDAAVMLAVDALESADRPLYEQAMAVVQWVAERDGNPRLVWRARTAAAGRAYLDGDIDRGVALAASARSIGEAFGLPGWMGAEFFFVGQEAISIDDPDRMPAAQLGDDFVGLLNPIGRAGVAYMLARCGHRDRAADHARQVMHRLEDESSYLMVCSRLAAVAAELDDPALQREILDLLRPWIAHVAVDSHAWCCDGPIAVWAAILARRLGHVGESVELLQVGAPLARALGDVRSLRRVEELSARLPGGCATLDSPMLTPRELEVLRLLATGATNAAIADRLAFSMSTIRKDTISIYRKLGVTGRAEAVSRAMADGLVTR
jgi:DNA-binding CsgD family transcriptional regulator